VDILEARAYLDLLADFLVRFRGYFPWGAELRGMRRSTAILDEREEFVGVGVV
jgi:hypothetical protein